ncbi:hypothetical protein CYLTODRAFT_421209 [Cylindrobasidium torrendii FP15055 ss-10]|uniref:Uncharacterized protein n=1 Tax=Cylindrobasidium torrendii FP15055 ss-10 TaxID=1314674 RepID=A0A0D7BF95_9AGAR|nr:hypothetical protein CYLTODRAFT_421209 [Cylindrobasidium torrendii FP15055 ss-10]
MGLLSRRRSVGGLPSISHNSQETQELHQWLVVAPSISLGLFTQLLSLYVYVQPSASPKNTCPRQ